jgi:hypothetical protein
MKNKHIYNFDKFNRGMATLSPKDDSIVEDGI